MDKKKNKDLDGSQMLSPKQKRIAGMAPPFNKIDEKLYEIIIKN